MKTLFQEVEDWRIFHSGSWHDEDIVVECGGKSKKRFYGWKEFLTIFFSFFFNFCNFGNTPN